MHFIEIAQLIKKNIDLAKEAQRITDSYWFNVEQLQKELELKTKKEIEEVSK